MNVRDFHFEADKRPNLCPTCGAYWKCDCEPERNYLREFISGAVDQPSGANVELSEEMIRRAYSNLRLRNAPREVHVVESYADDNIIYGRSQEVMDVLRRRVERLGFDPSEHLP